MNVGVDWTGELTRRYFCLPSPLSPVPTLAATFELRDFAEHIVACIRSARVQSPKTLQVYFETSFNLSTMEFLFFFFHSCF